MDDFRKSNYAINKVRKGIVYRNADGDILEVTFEKIAAENPEFTAEDFEKLKALSDELYHEEAKNDWRYNHHIKDEIIEETDEREMSVLNWEDDILNHLNDVIFKEKLNKIIEAVLTPVQRRRFKMFLFGGLTYREIAQSEGADIKSVWESVNLAKNKI